MKPKFYSSIFALVITFFCSFTVVAQSSVGIPVQGIARDVNGTARINTQIDLTFDLYYFDGGNEVRLYSPSQIESVTTDSFGVFSAIVNVSGRRAVFSTQDVFLRIIESGTVISDEPLNTVPYAISANNGVPTGSIMPFAGTTAPEGWLLCDGSPIPAGSSDPQLVNQYDALRALIGNNTPNLQGMFLRGTGVSPVNGQAGPALGQTQGDQLKQHNHNFSLTANSNGAHNHTVGIQTNQQTSVTNGAAGPRMEPQGSTSTSTNGAHEHSIRGTIFNSGGPESRPVNYGVNYIIKL